MGRQADRYPEQLEGGLAPHRVQKLYYATAEFLLSDRQPISPPTITTKLEIGAERFEKKAKAFQQHKTQAPLFQRVRKNLGESMGTMEMYHLAAVRDPREGTVETDLFDGVMDE